MQKKTHPLKKTWKGNAYALSRSKSRHRLFPLQCDHLLSVPGLFPEQDGSAAAACRGRFGGAWHRQPPRAEAAARHVGVVQSFPLLGVALGKLPSGGVVSVRHAGAQAGDGEQWVGAVRRISERETVQSHLGAAQALVVLEAALLLPQHDDERAAQHVAGRVAQRLLVLRIARAAHHARLALLEAALTIPEVGFHVRI